jgi:hypothetical protein
MNSSSPGRIDGSEFANCTGNPSEEKTLHVWNTGASPALSAPLPPPAAGAKVWAIGVPVKSNRATMLFVDVCLDCDASAGEAVTRGYRTSFVVEW